MKLYFDEAGNTGTDLHSKDQPIAVLASTCLDADACASLISPLLRQGQVEAKYSRLKGSNKGQQDLLRFFSSEILTPEVVKAEVADKQFSLVAHLVDKLIEPGFDAMGIDLTDGDGQMAYANMLYFAGPGMLPAGGWDYLLERFGQAIHRPSEEAFDALKKTLAQTAQYAFEHRDTSEPLLGLTMAPVFVDQYIGGLVATTAFDPMPNIFTSLVNYWMRQTPDWLEVVHDKSKPMKRAEDHLRELMTPLPTQKVGHGDRVFELPLRISSLSFEDSKDHPALQVADLVAGGVMDFFSALAGYKEFTPFHEALRETKLIDLIVDGIVPSQDLTPENEAKEGETSITDGVFDFLMQARAMNSQRV
ncbi:MULTISPECIES: DUF3800 domain-containing protein [unclassified Luteibacter]|uniref:DUF3800 domain-containing protein n=1 Tax=Luteibacter sp. PvP019 TaxID=3156436 RepID=UPI003392E9C8